MGKVYEFNPRSHVKSNVAHTAVILVPTEEGDRDRRVPRSPYPVSNKMEAKDGHLRLSFDFYVHIVAQVCLIS